MLGESAECQIHLTYIRSAFVCVFVCVRVHICCVSVGKSVDVVRHHRRCCCCNRQMSADYEKFSNNWIKLNFQQTEQLLECLRINFQASDFHRFIAWIFCWTHSLWMRISVSAWCTIYFSRQHTTVSTTVSPSLSLSLYVFMCAFELYCVISCHLIAVWIKLQQPMPTLMLRCSDLPLSERLYICMELVERQSTVSCSLWTKRCKNCIRIIAYSIVMDGETERERGGERDQVMSLLYGFVLCKVQLLCMNEPNWNADEEEMKNKWMRQYGIRRNTVRVEGDSAPHTPFSNNVGESAAEISLTSAHCTGWSGIFQLFQMMGANRWTERVYFMPWQKRTTNI